MPSPTGRIHRPHREIGRNRTRGIPVHPVVADPRPRRDPGNHPRWGVVDRPCGHHRHRGPVANPVSRVKAVERSGDNHFSVRQHPVLFPIRLRETLRCLHLGVRECRVTVFNAGVENRDLDPFTRQARPADLLPDARHLVDPRHPVRVKLQIPDQLHPLHSRQSRQQGSLPCCRLHNHGVDRRGRRRHRPSTANPAECPRKNQLLRPHSGDPRRPIRPTNRRLFLQLHDVPHRFTTLGQPHRGQQQKDSSQFSHFSSVTLSLLYLSWMPRELRRDLQLSLGFGPHTPPDASPQKWVTPARAYRAGRSISVRVPSPGRDCTASR
jgi:hypothetical protein